jgi:glycosyltransferase involved in cell wall biosynthesis
MIPGMRRSPLRVGMLSTVAWRTPPRHYGPWERVVSILTEGLVARGVDVTLFATADSETQAGLQAVAARGYAEDPSIDAKVFECLHIASLFERAEQFDLLHNHFDFLPLSYSRLVDTPLVTTIHGFSSERIVPAYRAYDDRSYYVAISNADRHPDLTYAVTIYHGVPMEEFTFREQAGEYLLFFGRIHHDKGAHEAVELARRTGRRLVLAGIVADEAYFKAQVEPFLDGDRIQYVGSAGPEKRDELLGGAAALVHLVNFDEPFGLSVVEALATGTPVIARPRGSLPELIDQGRTGFLANDLEQAAEAVEQLSTIDRGACRREAETRFSAQRMVDDYLALYEDVVAGRALLHEPGARNWWASRIA